MKKTIFLTVALLLMASFAYGQSSTTGTTSLTVNVAAAAALQVNTATTSLTQGGIFSDFTGTTSLTYWVRTTPSSGSGTIVLQVTSDFSPTGGPSVASPPAGDSLTYTCTLGGVGTACSGSQTALTTGTTNVATFGANARSAKAGDSASVSWTLTNDPQYPTGSYSATATFTISAT
ncbi:MAG: hypothetical protein LAO07_01005 [Acidobacteriia bacterium]|nr:hypothetical protein [Terriglobia bacterium]